MGVTHQGFMVDNLVNISKLLCESWSAYKEEEGFGKQNVL